MSQARIEERDGRYFAVLHVEHELPMSDELRRTIRMRAELEGRTFDEVLYRAVRDERGPDKDHSLSDTFVLEDEDFWLEQHRFWALHQALPEGEVPEPCTVETLGRQLPGGVDGPSCSDKCHRAVRSLLGYLGNGNAVGVKRVAARIVAEMGPTPWRATGDK